MNFASLLTRASSRFGPIVPWRHCRARRANGSLPQPVRRRRRHSSRPEPPASRRSVTASWALPPGAASVVGVAGVLVVTPAVAHLGWRLRRWPPRPGSAARPGRSRRRHAVAATSSPTKSGDEPREQRLARGKFSTAHPERRDGQGDDDQRRARRCRRGSRPCGAILVSRWANQPPRGRSAAPSSRTKSVRLSRTTVILIRPGYSSSFSIAFAARAAISAACSSSTLPGSTTSRISRPARIA